jgi:hypothetical protein
MNSLLACSRWTTLAVAAAQLAGCAATQGEVVLLPEREGRATAVVVQSAATLQW